MHSSYNRKNYFTGGSFGGQTRFSVGTNSKYKKFYTSVASKYIKPKYMYEYNICNDDIENFSSENNNMNIYITIALLLLLIYIAYY